MSDKIRGLLGLAFRAGYLVPGLEMALKLIREGNAALAIVDQTASANTQKKVRDACNHYQVRVMLVDAGILGLACGRPGMAAGAIKEGGFAEELRKLAT
ncbi:MAG: hypothetical protein GXZ04_01270 [Clostridiales bacterium]|nr:hypothetical protein [Clostridiales bacterium]